MPPTIEPWTLGVLFSITGHMAIPSQQHVLGVELAVEEVNAAGDGNFVYGFRLLSGNPDLDCGQGMRRFDIGTEC